MHNRRTFAILSGLLLSSLLLEAQLPEISHREIERLLRHIRENPKPPVSPVSLPGDPVPVLRDYRQDGSVFIRFSDGSTITFTPAGEKNVTRPSGINYSDEPSNAPLPTPPQLTRDNDMAWATQVADTLLGAISRLLSEDGLKRYQTTESGATVSKKIQMRANLISILTQGL